jgi:Transposase DDE domain
MLLAPIVEIFCDIDDFCKRYGSIQDKKYLPTLDKKKRNRQTQMSESELMTLLVLFQLSHYRTLKDFYLSCVLSDLSSYFPKAVSYPRFVALQRRVLGPLLAYVLSKAGEKTGLYYIDSSKLVVCHNRRIWGHRVFKSMAERGFSSVGYFFGFKLHVVINHRGELVSFCLTKGNVSDLNVASKLTKNLIGLIAGDKGYVSKKLEVELQNQGLKLITKLKKNMKKRAKTAFEKFFLTQRNLIETVIDQLKSVCHIEHTRHRSHWNFLVNLIGGLAAYAIKPRKPSLKTTAFQPALTCAYP